MPKTAAPLPHLGLIGLGHMGAAIAASLLEARFPLSVFDTYPRKAEPLVDAKAVLCESPAALALAADAILLRLPSSEAFVEMVEQQLLPGLTKGKTVIDLGATDVGHTRRLAEWLEAREVSFLDAPLSGGERAAREGRLSVFVGGRTDTFKRWQPLFKVLAALGNICYCGPAGSGQVVEGAEQLALSLSAAASLEAIAYARSFGIGPDALWEALQKTPLMYAGFEAALERLLREGGETVSVHSLELPHMLAAAQRTGQRLPLARALLDFLSQAPPSVIEQGRHVPSFWAELTRKPEPGA